ncbi:MAG TPA: hypothetical protein PK867_07020 [Pirellulales bacterium]|nr:hypothetical protein [Pirellulales bacterium]
MVSAIQPDYERSPVAWFVVLERARAEQDYERAAEAMRRLRELGVDVRYVREREAAE